MEAADQKEETAIARLRERMQHRYGRRVAPGDVDQVLAIARRRFEGSPVRTYVPILMERSVRAELDRRLRGSGGSGSGGG
ncbi:hypothetical protein ABIA32_003157 [Streptacidiphilus sp. MAP12-20]|uniref:three-helix bundle dimerization domain-containing protein n=1 Tax=Streptacidiphilus sp. MAP12-20 TaxID=3156299 RepID=UPI003515C4DE